MHCTVIEYLSCCVSVCLVYIIIILLYYTQNSIVDYILLLCVLPAFLFIRKQLPIIVKLYP
jgi:hypothetical protein